MKVFADPQKPKDLDKLLANFQKVPNQSRATLLQGVISRLLDKMLRLFFSMSMTMQQLRRSTLGSLANLTISFKEQSQLGTREA